eukprot:ANDGO_06586.mRNA.1 hypothetical protein
MSSSADAYLFCSGAAGLALQMKDGAKELMTTASAMHEFNKAFPEGMFDQGTLVIVSRVDPHCRLECGWTQMEHGWRLLVPDRQSCDILLLNDVGRLRLLGLPNVSYLQLYQEGLRSCSPRS